MSPSLISKLLFVAVCLLSTSGWTASLVSEEYGVKAAFLYRFTHYLEWPRSNFPRPDEPFHLCIIGDVPFGTALDALRGRHVQGRRLEVRQLTPNDDLDACEMVFVTAPAAPWSQEILAAVAGRPVVTVGETEGFAAAGGQINFILVDGKIRFEINVSAARRAGILISSKLLKLASLVGEGEETR